MQSRSKVASSGAEASSVDQAARKGDATGDDGGVASNSIRKVGGSSMTATAQIYAPKASEERAEAAKRRQLARKSDREVEGINREMMQAEQRRGLREKLERSQQHKSVPPLDTKAEHKARRQAASEARERAAEEAWRVAGTLDGLARTVNENLEMRATLRRRDADLERECSLAAQKMCSQQEPPPTKTPEAPSSPRPPTVPRLHRPWPRPPTAPRPRELRTAANLSPPPPPPCLRVAALAADLSELTWRLNESVPPPSPRASPVSINGADVHAAAAVDAQEIDLEGIEPWHQTFGKGKVYQVFMHHLGENPLCIPGCPAHGTTSGVHAEWCEHGIIMAAQKAAGTYEREIDLDGIMPDHMTYGRGSFYQIYQHDLRKNPLCTPSCPAWTWTPGDGIRCVHGTGCEHGIIKQAQKAAGTYNADVPSQRLSFQQLKSTVRKPKPTTLELVQCTQGHGLKPQETSDRRTIALLLMRSSRVSRQTSSTRRCGARWSSCASRCPRTRSAWWTSSETWTPTRAGR